MKSAPKWEFLGASPDGQSFLIGGLDVWKHSWLDTKEIACVKDPLYHQEFTFPIYTMGGDDAAVTFAAGEFSNCMWGFYVRTRNNLKSVANDELKVSVWQKEVLDVREEAIQARTVRFIDWQDAKKEILQAVR